METQAEAEGVAGVVWGVATTAMAGAGKDQGEAVTGRAVGAVVVAMRVDGAREMAGTRELRWADKGVEGCMVAVGRVAVEAVAVVEAEVAAVVEAEVAAAWAAVEAAVEAVAKVGSMARAVIGDPVEDWTAANRMATGQAMMAGAAGRQRGVLLPGMR